MPEARALFAKAIALDADYGAAYGMAGFSIIFQQLSGLLAPSAPEIAEGARLARLAAATGRDDATALSCAGTTLARTTGDPEAGALLIERACAINPNSALAWNGAGWVRLWLGDLATSIANFERAVRLSPVDPLLYLCLNGIAQAHFMAGRYDDALAWAERAVSEQPNYLTAYRLQPPAYALSGRMDEARRAMAELRRLAPQMRLSNVGDWMAPYRRGEDVARWVEGLRLAGLPE
jgi:tetratricopeptide (TPR) repeat protein